MVFISCHLEAGNKFEERRAQYQELSYELGGKLGHGAGVDLGTQFHHIVWVGDLNYRCVQGAEPGHRDKSFPGDRAIALLEQVKSTPPSFFPTLCVAWSASTLFYAPCLLFARTMQKIVFFLHASLSPIFIRITACACLYDSDFWRRVGQASLPL